MIEIEIKIGDVRKTDCDVLVMKYAHGFHGADGAVADALGKTHTVEYQIGLKERHGHVLVPSGGSIGAENVMFISVGALSLFEYAEIRAFTRRALELVKQELPSATHVAMTMHGVGYGLDEKESFLAQLGGIADAESSGISNLRVSIVDRDQKRAWRLEAILLEVVVRDRRPTGETGAGVERPGPAGQIQKITAGYDSLAKPHIFVAMPFSKELEDVFVFGIQTPINSAGYLCERMDMTTFTGDILDRIKARIESSALVVAELTGANPNVYLEVGYAWGRNRPTLLLAKESEKLGFDLQGQRCLKYENIVDLKNKLEKDLAELAKGRGRGIGRRE